MVPQLIGCLHMEHSAPLIAFQVWVHHDHCKGLLYCWYCADVREASEFLYSNAAHCPATWIEMYLSKSAQCRRKIRWRYIRTARSFCLCPWSNFVLWHSNKKHHGMIMPGWRIGSCSELSHTGITSLGRHWSCSKKYFLIYSPENELQQTYCELPPDPRKSNWTIITIPIHNCR